MNSRGSVVTFYSFKGGVGRSMAVANVAALLSRWGKRVLIIDWDLEAPGIEKYFEKWISTSSDRQTGVVDLAAAFVDGETIDWRKCILTASPPGGQSIHIIPSGTGTNDKDYVRNLRRLDWVSLFKAGFGSTLERLRNELIVEYDFVLVDSRTGITDIGGICTIHLPDIVVSLFTSNQQSLDGINWTMKKACQAHARLPVDRRKLLIVPVPARDESGSEYELAAEWRQRFSAALSEFFADWVPTGEDPDTVMNYLKIPYSAYWSFGERVPVLEQQDADNPKTLAYSYQPLARLLLSGLDWNEVRNGSQASEEAKRQEARIAALNLEAERVRTAAEAAMQQREAERLEQLRLDLESRIAAFKSRVMEQVGQYRRRATLARLFGLYAAIGALGGLVIAFYQWRLASIHSKYVEDSSLSLMLGGLTLTLACIATFGYFRFFRRVQIAADISSALEREQAIFDAGTGPYLSQSLERKPGFDQFTQRIERMLELGEWHFRRNRVFERPLGDLVGATVGRSERYALVPSSEGPSGPGGRSTETVDIRPRRAPPEPMRTQAATGQPEGYRFAAYISSEAKEGIASAWLEEFEPLLGIWLRELNPNGEGVASPRRHHAALGNEVQAAVASMLSATRCLIPIITPGYVRSPWCMSEFRRFIRRRGTLETPLMVPILLVPLPRDAPDEVRSVQMIDMTDFPFSGEAFRRTELYVRFQMRVQEVARKVVEIAAQAPPFDPDGPERVSLALIDPV